jgi:arsenate reductase-like glutaredoxin family protein
MLQAKLKVKKPVDLVCGNKQASEPTAAELATIVASISTSMEKSMGSRGKQQAASSKWQTRAVTTDDQLNTLRGSTESWTKRVGLVADEKDSICAS